MAAQSPNVDKAKIIKSLTHESMQTHYVYDGSNRNTYIYQAVTGTKNGGPCLVTKFSFTGANTYADGSVEYVGTWDATWEIAEG